MQKWLPVASLRFVAGAARGDPLFQQVLARRSNKEIYEARDVPPAALAQLAAAARVYGVTSMAVGNETLAGKLRDLTWRAHLNEVTTPSANQESVDLMRIGARESTAILEPQSDDACEGDVGRTDREYDKQKVAEVEAPKIRSLPPERSKDCDLREKSEQHHSTGAEPINESAHHRRQQGRGEGDGEQSAEGIALRPSKLVAQRPDEHPESSCNDRGETAAQTDGGGGHHEPTSRSCEERHAFCFQAPKQNQRTPLIKRPVCSESTA